LRFSRWPKVTTMRIYGRVPPAPGLVRKVWWGVVKFPLKPSTRQTNAMTVFCVMQPWGPDKGQQATLINRWEFMLTIAPLSVTGGTGSPVNALATF